MYSRIEWFIIFYYNLFFKFSCLQLFWFYLYIVWVGLLGYGFFFVIGFVIIVLCEYFGCCVMICVGSVLIIVFLFVMLFVFSIVIMYFMFGVVWGIGGSFLFFFGLFVLRFYFNRNFFFVNGIIMIGVGFGIFVFNVMLQEFDEKYGWWGGMCFLSVFFVLMFLCGCVFILLLVDYLVVERLSFWFWLKRFIDLWLWRD